MEVESINIKNSPFLQNNKYIEYINKDNTPEKLQTQIMETIKIVKIDIMNQINFKFENINENFNIFNNKLEEIKKNIKEANILINNQLNNILTHINQRNDNESLNKNIIQNQNILAKENEEHKEKKNEAKYKKVDINKYSLKNIFDNKKKVNEEKNIIKNDIKIIFKDNSALLNQNQNNEKKSIKEIKTEREKEKERSEFDLQSINIINNKNKKEQINTLRRHNTNLEYFFRHKPINQKMSRNMLNYNKSINYNNNNADEGSNTKYLNTDIDKNEKNTNTNKIYQSINNIFFYDFQQKNIRAQKINEYQKEELKNAILNDQIKGKNILKNYYMNYIEENILPLFKKKNLPLKQDIIKYNISIILECLGMDKNYYNNYYNKIAVKQQNINRNQSREAVARFRKEFKISKEDFTDEAIENKLIENNLDINKAFGKMFG